MATASARRLTASGRITQLRRWARSDRRRRLLTGYLFVLPAVLYFGRFFVVSVIEAFTLSLTRWKIITEPVFVGLDNYARLVSDQAFHHSLLVTWVYTIGVTVASLVIALALGVLLQRSWPLIGLIRTGYFVPLVVPLLVVGVVWNYAFNVSYGFIPEVTSALGFGRAGWLDTPSLAMPALIIVGIWRMVGFSTILFIAGLEGIPEELYEIAKIDGASSWASFRFITLPLLRPTTIMVLIVTVLFNLQIFDLVYSLTLGGPGDATRVALLNIYETGFRHLEMGYALAKAMVFLVMMLIISLVQMKTLGGYSVE